MFICLSIAHKEPFYIFIKFAKQENLLPFATYSKKAAAILAADGSEHRQSRCSAIESLQAVFRWKHQFAVKWHFQAIQPGNAILQQIDSGSNILLLLGPAKPVLRIVDERAKALSYFPGGLSTAWKAPIAGGRFLQGF